MNIITEDNYVDVAENVIGSLVRKSRKDKFGNPMDLVTTSQIRNILAMTAEIYNEVSTAPGEELSQRVMERLQYLRVRVLYEAGRDNKVRNFVTEGKLLEILKSMGNTKKDFNLFNHYMEALVAYHRFEGGKD